MLENIFLSKKATYKILKHGLYWVFIYLFFSFPNGIIYDLLLFFLKRNLIYILIDIIFVYTIIHFIPIYIPKKQYGSFLFLYFSFLILYFLIKYFIYKEFEPVIFRKYINQVEVINQDYSPTILILNDFYQATARYIIVTLPPIVLKTFNEWYQLQINSKKLEKESLEHKIQLLRIQLHPHFLFNTLNNLYSLALGKSDKVPEIIIKISEILRYILKEHNRNLVTFKEEFEIIQNYIDLEKLRYDESLTVEIENKVPEMYSSILKGPPLLLFTFVENAFKHGPSSSLSNSWIKIHFSFKNWVLHFMIENSKEDEKNNKSDLGVGLKNAISTLQLYFQDRHNIQITETSNVFKIHLKIFYN